MIADYFWKIIFVIILIIGLKFWLDVNDKNNIYEKNLRALTEILETPPSKSDKQCQRLAFQSIFHLYEMDRIKRMKFLFFKGDKLDIGTVLKEIFDADYLDAKNSLIKDVLEENYSTAEEFGLFENEQSLEALEEGRATKIMGGPWRGELLVVGHYISPDISKKVQFHFVNRIILPKSVKAAMAFADITKDVRDRADRLKRGGVLDTKSFDEIIIQYNTIRELSTR